MTQLEKQLPSKAEMDALLSDINQAGLGRSLQFELFRPGQVNVKEYYAELPIAVRVTGRYHDIGAFASDVANLSRIVTLNNLVDHAAEGRRADAWTPRPRPSATSMRTKSTKQRKAAPRREQRNEHGRVWRSPPQPPVLAGCGSSEPGGAAAVDGGAARADQAQRAADPRAEEVHAAGLHRRKRPSIRSAARS